MPKANPRVDDKLLQRREQVRLSRAKHAERLRQMTPLERAVWKERDRLGENFDPYTPEEREALERLKAVIRQAEDEAAQLHAQVCGRLEQESGDSPALREVLAGFREAPSVQILVKPH